MALTTINSSGIKDDSLVNADIKSDAAIAGSKLVAATTSVSGSMSAADKTKLDGVATSATANPSAPALTGSTNNTICTVTGANAIQGEANLTFDGTTLNVGTGSGSTASAGYDEFVIQGGDADIGMNFLSPAANDKKQQISFGDSNNNQSGRIVYDHDGDHLTIGTNGTAERLRIDSSGNVLIGTTSAGAEFHVKGGGTVAKFEGTGGNGFISLVDSDDSTQCFLGCDGGTFKIQTSGNSWSDKLIVDSSGRILAGTTSVGWDDADDLTVAGSANVGITIRSGDDDLGTLAFADGTSGADGYRGWVQYKQSSEYMTMGTNGTQRLRVDGDGLKFGSDSAAANALDSYEEGSWTPTATAGTFAVASGTYTKIGRLVTAFFVIEVHSTTSGNHMQFNGLPFTNAGNAGENMSSIAYNETGNVMRIYVNDGVAGLFWNDSTSFFSYANCSGDRIRGGVSYFAST